LKTTPNLVEGIFKSSIICIRLQRLFAQHCAKEQQLLYPLLSRYLSSNVSKLLTQEHKEISNTMRKIAEHIPTDGKATHWETMSQLDQLLRTHFSKEENVLFWYLDLQLVSLSS
jgi:iron-sulfur cluster repair protein YtfE (RIC family)